MPSRAQLGIRAPVAVLHKRRDDRGVVHTSISGDVGGHALIVDDILDTGGTLVSGCRRLRAEGTTRITVLVTHALLTGARWRELPSLGVDRIVTTDSLPNARRRGAGAVEILPAGPLVVAALTTGVDVTGLAIGEDPGSSPYKGAP